MTAGVRPDALDGLLSCAQLANHDHDWAQDLGWLVEAYDYNGETHFRNSAGANKAMEINDNPDLVDSYREQQLIEIFARNGDELEFVG